MQTRLQTSKVSNRENRQKFSSVLLSTKRKFQREKRSERGIHTLKKRNNTPYSATRATWSAMKTALRIAIRITSELENTCSRTKDRGDHSTTEPLSGKERWLDNCDRPTDFVRDYYRYYQQRNIHPKRPILIVLLDK